MKSGKIIFTRNITKIKQNKTYKLNIKLLFKTPSIENPTNKSETSKTRKKTSKHEHREHQTPCTRSRPKPPEGAIGTA